MLDLNIVIVNFYSKDSAIKAIRSVLTDVLGCPLNVQVTVVDNSQNQDGVKDALSQLDNHIRYVDALGNIGFGKGNNLGFKAVLARYQMILNPDTIIPSGSSAIERLVKFMDEHPKIGAVGPKLLYPDGSLQYSSYRFDRPSILIKPFKQINWDKKYKFIKKFADRLEMKDWEHNETRPVDWVLGAVLILRSEAAKKIGWFDRRYFMYLEDCDLCQTLWENGIPVYYAHDIAVTHYHERLSAVVPGALVALIKNKLARVHLASWLKYLWKWRKLHKYYVKLS